MGMSIYSAKVEYSLGLCFCQSSPVNPYSIDVHRLYQRVGMVDRPSRFSERILRVSI
mgnify:CR=1 FL=1